ncbi:MAG: redoxin domain-containing protein, partial [Planctomycetota bacterium]
SDSKGIPFPLLSDEGSETIHAYGLHFQKGLPHPATILIDQDGVIRAKLMEEGYVSRHSVDELVSAAEQLQ